MQSFKCLAVALIAFVSPIALQAQPPQPGSRTCHAEKQPLESEADLAVQKRDYAAAEPLYREAIKEAGDDEAAYATAIRKLTELLGASQKSLDAIATVNEALKKYPANGVLLDAQGQAYFRHGEIAKAGAAYNAALMADPCSAQLRYHMASFDMLDAQYANAKQKLTIAHQLAPWNKAISAALDNLSGHGPSNQTLVQQLTARMNDEGTTEAQKTAVASQIKYLQAEGRGDCRMVNPVAKAKIALHPITFGASAPVATSLDVTMNTQKKRFLLDTGASGLIISRAAAQSAGLISEAEGAVGGIGDQGAQRVTLAHINDLRIGPLQFQNCLVRIMDQPPIPTVDGLIGSDVFSSYLLTLDFPDGEMLLAPLPKRPGADDTAELSLNTAGNEFRDGTPQNRYIAPGMEKWTRLLRAGHLLIFPTEIHGGATRLFVMDSGAMGHEAVISIEASKEVTGVVNTNNINQGMSGIVKDVRTAQTIALTFGGVSEQLHDVPAINLGTLSFAGGTTISGLIGYKTLSLLILTIDYRDSLVKVEYHRQSDM